MTTPSQCPECSSNLEASAPGGLCPQCLLHQGLGEEPTLILEPGEWDGVSAPAAGDVLGGRYRIRGVLGRGGMGTVYLAQHLELDVPVALKAMSLPGSDPQAIERLRREAQILHHLHHLGLPRVYDFFASDPHYYLAMEYIDGQTLQQVLGQGLPPEPQVVAWARELCDVLEYLHQQNPPVIFRDLKPSNVMVDAKGNLRVIDFGIARTLYPDSDTTTFIKGTGSHGFAPVEQYGGSCDPRTDIYALGATAYVLVTGTVPPPSVLIAEGGLALTPPSQINPQVSPRLEGIILRMMALQRDDRYQSVSEVARDLSSSTEWQSVRPSAPLRPRAASPEVLTNLPTPATALVGREDDLSAANRLFEEGTRLLCLTGAGGSGKTRLAVEYAVTHHRRHAPAGGTWFVDLTEVRDVDGICAAVADVLGIALATGDPPSHACGRSLALRGEMLMVLDNFEQVIAQAGETVGRWMAVAPQARFLVTSRERLNLSGETTYSLGPLGLPLPGAGPDEIASCEAARLFSERVRAHRPGYTMSPSDLSAVADIVRELDGLPLAIELAAARMRSLSATQILERLPHRLDLLSGGPRDVAARQATLRTTIDWSWNLLMPWEQRGLAQCSVFRGGFSMEAAEAVLDGPGGLSVPSILDIVQALCDKSLLRMYEPAGFPGVSRFGMYESIREYGGEKLLQADAGPARERHANYYLRVGLEWSQAAESDPSLARVLALERENLLAVVRRSLGTAPQTVESASQALLGLLALDPVFVTRGPYPTYIGLLDKVLSGSAGIEPRLVARGHYARAWVLRGCGRMREAIGEFESALELARQHGDKMLQGRALTDLGILFRMQGKVRESRRHLDAALPIVREVGDVHHEGMAVLNLGQNLQIEGRYDEARPLVEQGVGLLRNSGDRRCYGVSLGFAADLERDLGFHQEALGLYAQAVALLDEAGDRRLEGLFTGSLGLAHHLAGDLASAAASYERALALLQEVGARLYEGTVIGQVGLLCLEQGNPKEAAERLQRAVEVAAGTGDGQSEGLFLGYLALARERMGDKPAAVAYLARAETVLRGIGNQASLAALNFLRASMGATPSPPVLLPDSGTLGRTRHVRLAQRLSGVPAASQI